MKIIITAFAALLLTSCAGRAEKKQLADLKGTIDNVTSTKEEESGYKTDSTGGPVGQVRVDKQKQPVQATANPDWDKKIIKTATIDFEVKDFKIYYNSLREKVRQAGGYISQEQQNQTAYKLENTISIKVPVDQFDNTMAALTTGIEKIDEKQISSEDVTGEYVDTKSRMEAKKQVRQRYIDLLGQAKNMQEVLDVQSEINSIQEEIESANGRIEYLSHASAFSTINLTCYQVLNASAKDDDSPSFGAKISRAFKNGWAWIGSFLVELVSIWPVFALIILLLVWVKKTRFLKVIAKK